MAAYIEKGDISFEYKHTIVLGARSQWAAEASECAADQGKFWAYHDNLFRNQKKTFSLDQLKKWGADLGLDTATFNQCVDSHKYEAKVKASTAEASKAGIKSTPTFVLNGKIIGSDPNTVVALVKQAVNQK